MWGEWVCRVTGGASARQIALRVHRSRTSVARWVRDGDPPAEVVIQIAREFGADPVAGLLAAGCLTKDELVPHFRASLKYMPLTLLTDEVAERARGWEAAVGSGEEFSQWWVVPRRDTVDSV